ncbi:MAG: hypothetical protein IM631_04650 [Cytophagales bacterium]|nr:hypothetical protein [Cytophagales bacterium]MCA6383578.1 hypothetical protein [Cytophagales bacterium]
MFDEDFCGRLEYAISGALTKSKDVDWRRCWCDGVLLPDNETDYSQGQILRTKEVVTKAWIEEGETKEEQRGQFLYNLRLIFGDNSLNKIKRGDRLEDCIPDIGADSWLVLDQQNRTIEVQLI